jgi:hypothetical protein
MRGPSPSPCSFPKDFLQEARDKVRRRTARCQDVQRYRLVLLLHENQCLGNAAAAQQVGLSERQVRRWRQRWIRGDYSIEDREGRGCKATFSPAGPCSRHRSRL